ncbi:MAG: type II toxin-antitoxin system VapB family antitoxin [Pseudonocardiaceae bacterium]
MTRITIDVNDEWLEAARDIPGTETRVATVNEALRSFAVHKQAKEIVAALASAEMDYAGSAVVATWPASSLRHRLRPHRRDHRAAMEWGSL